MGRLLRAAPLPPWLRPLLLLLAGGECAPAGGRAGGRPRCWTAPGRQQRTGAGRERGLAGLWRRPSATRARGEWGAWGDRVCLRCVWFHARATPTHAHQRVSPGVAAPGHAPCGAGRGALGADPGAGRTTTGAAGRCDSPPGTGGSIGRSPGAATASGWECLRLRGAAAAGACLRGRRWAGGGCVAGHAAPRPGWATDFIPRRRRRGAAAPAGPCV